MRVLERFNKFFFFRFMVYDIFCNVFTIWFDPCFTCSDNGRFDSIFSWQSFCFDRNTNARSIMLSINWRWSATSKKIQCLTRIRLFFSISYVLQEICQLYQHRTLAIPIATTTTIINKSKSKWKIQHETQKMCCFWKTFASIYYKWREINVRKCKCNRHKERMYAFFKVSCYFYFSVSYRIHLSHLNSLHRNFPILPIVVINSKTFWLFIGFDRKDSLNGHVYIKKNFHGTKYVCVICYFSVHVSFFHFIRVSMYSFFIFFIWKISNQNCKMWHAYSRNSEQIINNQRQSLS